MNFDIACIIPAYNAAAHLTDALDSIMAQSVRPKVLVVDDGSTDDTFEIARAYGHGVKAIRQPNAGCSVARNLGVASTRSALIAFLDADDLWEPTRLQVAADAFDADPTLAVQVCLAQNVNPDGTLAGEPIPAYVAGGMVLRRTAWEAVGPFNGELPHGALLDWFIRAREAGVQIQMIGQPLLRRRLRGDSMSHADPAGSHREHLSVLRASLARRRERA